MTITKSGLADYTVPNKPLPCRYCEGHGSLPSRAYPEQPWVRWGGECPACLGTGDQFCYAIGQPGCGGYATRDDGEYVCEFHFTHCRCGADLIRQDGEVLCPVCDKAEIARLWPERISVGEAA